MNEFTVEKSKFENVLVLRTKGYLDDLGGQKFKKECVELIKEGNNYFVFNLHNTPVINSTGLSTLLDLIVEITDSNEGEVGITGLNPLTRTAMQMTGVMTLADVFNSEQEAIKAISQVANI